MLGHAATFGANQPEYLPLPVVVIHRPEVEVISCWMLSWRERLKMLLTGKIWISQYSFGHALQPIRPTVNEPYTKADAAPGCPKCKDVGQQGCAEHGIG